MVDDTLRQIFHCWIGAVPISAAASFWWWETLRDSNPDCRVSMAFTIAASSPGAFLWLEYTFSYLGMQVGGVAEPVYYWSTTIITLLWTVVFPFLLLAGVVLRPDGGSRVSTNLIQASHLLCSLASSLVAAYFAVGI